MKSFRYLLLLLAIFSQAHAQSITQLKQTHLSEMMAKQWGVPPKDYHHYQWLMQHTASGQWYKQLDPAEVLALNASNQAQMLKYAKLEASVNHRRITQEFLFNNLYHQAYKALYPTEKAIMDPERRKHPIDQLQAGDHIWLFLSLHNSMSDLVFSHLIHLIKTNHQTYLDIYFTDNMIRQSDIQVWAMSHHLPQDLLNHHVSLNVDQHRLSTVSNNQAVTLPYLGTVRNHHFQAISLASVMG